MQETLINQAPRPFGTGPHSLCSRSSRWRGFRRRLGLRPWSISSRYWQDSHATDDRLWIAPDIPVGLSSEDYFANRDPALEAVLRLFASGHEIS